MSCMDPTIEIDIGGFHTKIGCSRIEATAGRITGLDGSDCGDPRGHTEFKAGLYAGVQMVRPSEAYRGPAMTAGEGIQSKKGRRTVDRAVRTVQRRG